MAEPAAAVESFRGQPCLRLSLDGHNSLLVALHGAHLLSWTGAGAERLFLSPRALFDGRSAIRGGVPVCLPQFNERGPLPKHGFVRNLPWRAGGARVDAASGDLELTLELASDAATRATWPHDFHFALTLRLGPGRLAMRLDLHNTGATAWSFTGALHTYLRVQDAAAVRLDGLDGQPCWDALTDRRVPHAGAVRLDGEFDRVFRAAAAPLRLHDGATVLSIAQSASFEDTVVWNPGAAKCAGMADMAPDSHAQMLCVEAAQVERPVALAPDARWSGWQRLQLA
ncbi:D-hexose-6-phosphate mutarotase [Pseudorhodoferax sp.]|uniref:D-hexose-6-phosphate mutarotase n=1 Tax=Pseudorhodoferax sp. TaxID=1993553 RepID=UPI0039E68392